MELEKMKALLCVIELGSLSAAAEKRGYTTSGMSRMMAALESELGFSLLIRTRDGVRPTEECRQLLPAIRRFVRSGDECLQEAGRIRGLCVGHVIIGTAYTAFYRGLANVAKLFHEQYPGVIIEIQPGYSSELLKKMQRHQTDFCIISRRSGISGWIPLCEDPMMAWVPSGHPLAGEAGVPIHAFTEEYFIDTYPGADIDNACIFEKFGIRPNTQFYTRDSYATWKMVDAGLGISMNNSLNGREWQGEVKILPLIPDQRIEIGIAYEEEMTLAGKMFLNFMNQHTSEFLPAERPLRGAAKKGEKNPAL